MPESSGSDDRRDEYTFQYSLEENAQPVLAIVEAVAWVKGADASEIEPLQRTVDIEALAKLLSQRGKEFNRSASAEQPNLRVTFPYEGYEVTLTSNEIRVNEP